MKHVASKEVVEQFRLLDKKIDAALNRIRQLKKENEQLRQRLEETIAAQQRAAQRLDDVLDKFDALT